ncbi:MAG: BlaI/MecI/CopY family transcriptional regulator [Oscillospiraceae bacterium]|nr:BlaI/MecI/CopY family transcriptional regulator [Oscillospiraceae bacterium]
MFEKKTKLPDAELEVMQLLWRCQAPVARATVEAEMAKLRPMAQTTLLTLLTRLADKGFVRIEKQGRSSVYTPLVSEADYQARQSKRFVDQLFGGSMSAFASALTASGLSKEDLAELRQLLDEDRL